MTYRRNILAAYRSATPLSKLPSDIFLNRKYPEAMKKNGTATRAMQSFSSKFANELYDASGPV
jgi:hypothetical protein